MKRNILVFSVLILANIFAPNANAMSEVKHLFGYDDSNKVASHPGERVDTVKFWETVENLLEKNGYDKNSEFYRHAHANLQRVETLRKHHRTPRSKVTKQVTKEPRAEKLKSNKLNAEKLRKDKTEREAFLKGKKSGEAHEKYLLKKKAAEQAKAKRATQARKAKKKVKKEVK